MLASLLRPKKRRAYAQNSVSPAPHNASESQWPLLNGEIHRGRNVGHDGLRGDEISEEDAGADGEDEDAPIESTPLLPIFSVLHLDTLPVYDITHAIRSLIISRCETTLTWDQLRSPQISQFLVKPIQQKIKALHFSRATLYTLMANCLQFDREVHLNPGNSGTNHTRAMVSELLAMRLLRDYTSRELIDALSYDFYPLHGQKCEQSPRRPQGRASAGGGKPLPGVARISCLEIAIRAQAKRFLSHPLVVKQLEAIWAGTIVFHSAADSLHRSHAQPHYGRGARQYGSTPYNNVGGYSHKTNWSNASSLRRVVTLYDPRDASAFKLSRLRVPRYRQFISTLSFAVLLVLFLAVLQERNMEIGSLEVLFWLWSAGFMLDEIVGFNEQGFSLYLMSFWNIFDLGILVLLFCYYCMRLYGAFLPYTQRQAVTERAYDILAANAVLLFPRLFSILDHYRYFSQLLIAFRIMASDLLAVFVPIIIACSGFFVAFTLSFSRGQDQTPGSIAYALFQVLMGFTPAAWTLWDDYNILGRTILAAFLFICHFVVVTILITVLTNSFMSIVQNANQEHQFLFAINTISMVKSDALFSYVAPTNILAWLITPLRYLIPFRQYLRINRTIIKITHMPILFTICAYEKLVLGPQMIESTDLVNSPILSESSGEVRGALNSRGPRFVREPSVTTFQKDRALEEVFRQPFYGNGNRRPTEYGQIENNNFVSNWMQAMGSEQVNPPDEQDSDEVNRLERLANGRIVSRRGQARSLRDFTDSTTSNPEGPVAHAISSPATPRNGRSYVQTRSRRLSHHTDIEGDNELTSDDNNDGNRRQPSAKDSEGHSNTSNGSHGKATPKFYSSRPSTARRRSRKNSPNRFRHHSRNPSGATILYNPITSSHDEGKDDATNPPKAIPRKTPSQEFAMRPPDRHTLERRHSLDDYRVPSLNLFKPNPMSVPNSATFLEPNPGSWHRGTSILEGLGSDLGDGKAIANGFVGGVPSSLTTEMAYAAGGIRRRDSPHGSQDMLSKLVLARMNNIEEGFREVIKEVKDLRTSHKQSRADEQRTAQRDKRRTDKKRKPQGPRKGRTSDGAPKAEPTSIASHQNNLHLEDDV
ncbi:hypothetical protein BJX61DRAFT_383780 [Aspergillus egyptiacus]|nr:hypothetical protein BJX61DRAFT_383780 [Aspergillus egyptiacus]